jgi:hypothetical protein
MAGVAADAVLFMAGVAADAVLFTAGVAAALTALELAPVVVEPCIPIAAAIPAAPSATTTTPAPMMVQGCFMTSPLHILITEWVFARQYGEYSK